MPFVVLTFGDSFEGGIVVLIKIDYFLYFLSGVHFHSDTLPEETGTDIFGANTFFDNILCIPTFYF